MIVLSVLALIAAIDFLIALALFPFLYGFFLVWVLPRLVR